jgi:hypothetical protein
MNILVDAIKAVLGKDPPPRYDPDDDDVVQFLRDQKQAAIHETKRLRREYFPIADYVRKPDSGTK